MNTITSFTRPGLYKTRHDWKMALNGMPLDQWFDLYDDDMRFLGMVPALGNLQEAEDADLAWERMVPLLGQSLIAPLLICPEHQSLNCGVLVVEVLHLPGEFVWRRFGLNAFSPGCPSDPEDVRWLERLKPQSFTKAAYLKALEPFHLIRLDQKLQLEGKSLVLLWGLENRPQCLAKGTLHLTDQGLMLECPVIPPIALASEWLPLIRPMPAEDQRFGDQDYFLLLEDLCQPWPDTPAERLR